MALIQCKECGNKVSSQAVSCPHCGCPIKGITTIQKTSKIWKIIKLVSVLFILVGVLFGFVSFGVGMQFWMYFWIGTAIVGLLLFIISITGAWWANK